MANQMTITFNVDNQTLSRTDTNKIVEKSKNYLHATFTFSEDWEGTRKAVIVEDTGMKFKIYLDENNSCDIPNRAVSYDGFMITVIGEDLSDYVTITTNDLFVSVGKSNATENVDKYVKYIISNTLDVNKEEETYHLEIPAKYIDNEKLVEALRGYVDNESLSEILQGYVDNETFNTALGNKQDSLSSGTGIQIQDNVISTDRSKVVPNPTLSGDEAILEGAEIDGIKYKVGGGSGKFYNHKLNIVAQTGGYYIRSLNLEIINKSSTPLTYNDLGTYFPSSFTAMYKCSGESSKPSIVADVQRNPYAYFANENGTFYARPIFANNIDIVPNTATFTDTITEIE